ncbi:hypothetical protein NPIL_477251 [Nephila pilipes]|uniref:Uncharacterized protein n=1 Tax=Nephila pilipes TaxID=299642 RepID=A0A8X6PVE3_NEPPI|nr:hypothetical protein NPIL_477251 [Nephila pilipes]
MVMSLVFQTSPTFLNSTLRKNDEFVFASCRKNIALERMLRKSISLPRQRPAQWAHRKRNDLMALAALIYESLDSNELNLSLISRTGFLFLRFLNAPNGSIASIRIFHIKHSDIPNVVFEDSNLPQSKINGFPKGDRNVFDTFAATYFA